MATSNGYNSDVSSDATMSDESETSVNTTKTNDQSQSKVDHIKHSKTRIKSNWDPLLSQQWDEIGEPGPLAAARIRRDISSIFKEPLPGILTVPDEDNFCIVHCLLLGSFDTPYEGGFFHFLVRFGPNYPFQPPKVCLITTGRKKVRFNPNLYSNGKVCLSILGTWSGPAWSPASNLSSLLLSIQSIMNEKPYFNEPGFNKEKYVGQSDQYNLYLTHETLRVAVCGQMESILYDKNHERIPIPTDLHAFMKTTFLDFFEQYISTCDRLMHNDGQMTKDAYSEVDKSFDFSDISNRLKKINETLTQEAPQNTLNKESFDSPLRRLSLDGKEEAEVSGSKSQAAKCASIISEVNEFGITDEDSKLDSAMDNSEDYFLYDLDSEDEDDNEKGD